MRETEDRLYGLMEIAERQQAAVQAALDGLVAERAALQRERERLAREVQGVGLGTQAAVRSAVHESFLVDLAVTIFITSALALHSPDSAAELLLARHQQSQFPSFGSSFFAVRLSPRLLLDVGGLKRRVRSFGRRQRPSAGGSSRPLRRRRPLRTRAALQSRAAGRRRDARGPWS
jgi:hypothetical protein